MQETKLTQQFVDKILEMSQEQSKIYDNVISGLCIEIIPHKKPKWQLNCGHFKTIIGNIENITLSQAREKALILLSEVQLSSIKALSASINNVNFIPQIDANKSKRYFSTIKEILDLYIKAGGAKYIVSTIQSHFDLSIHVTEIDTLWADTWRKEFINKGHKIATGNRVISALRTMLNWAESRDICKSNLRHLKMLPETDSTIITRILSEDEDKRLRKALKSFNSIFQAIIIVELNTGIRLKALLNLLWEDVNFDNHTIRLRAATAKNRKTKYVPMNSEAEYCLQQLTITGEFIFTNPRTGVNYKNITKLWKSLLKKAQIENLRFHDLRHNVASQLAMNGVSLYEIGQILTHSDVKVTERYAHLLPDKKLQAVEMLAKKKKDNE